MAMIHGPNRNVRLHNKKKAAGARSVGSCGRTWAEREGGLLAVGLWAAIQTGPRPLALLVCELAAR